MNFSTKKLIAVIDDDTGVRESLKALLEALEYEVETFDSAEAFLGAAPRSIASCLVLDIELGLTSGIELARQLAAEGFKYPIIFITGRDHDDVRSRARRAGCVAFLLKPFPARQLHQAILKATENAWDASKF
jgi:FixJ family two-component response regulator